MVCVAQLVFVPNANELFPLEYHDIEIIKDRTLPQCSRTHDFTLLESMASAFQWSGSTINKPIGLKNRSEFLIKHQSVAFIPILKVIFLRYKVVLQKNVNGRFT